MKRHSRSALLLGIVALGVVLAAGLSALAAASQGQARRLPDGSTLRLEGVTYGKVHPWVHGAWWQKWLYPVVAPAVRNWSGLWAPRTGWLMGDFLSSAPNALVLHTFRRSVAGRGRLPLHSVACDDRGRELDSGWEAGGLLFSLPDGAEEAWEVPVFPRRGLSVRVRVYEHVPGNRLIPAAEFVVPNPTPGPFPVWKPQPLPITRHAGDLAVTLTRMAAGPPAAEPLQTRMPGEDAWTHATFRIEQNGRATTAWRPLAATVSDATGNVWKHRNERPMIAGDAIGLQFSGVLPSTEAAWKLRVELSQTSGFTPADLWSIHGLPAPKRDQHVDPAAVIQRQGAALHLSLTGAGDPFGLGRMWRQPFPTISVTVSPPSPGLQLTLLRAADDQGRRIDFFGGLPSSLGGGKYRFLVDRMPPGARTMNLLFAVHKNRFVEFLVAPPRAGG
jgi:hypothetical protein